MIGYEVKFATGTDENGQKMKQSAEKVGKELMPYLDEIAAQHKDTWDALKISYTDFIRTTESRHHTFVQQMLQTTYDAGDIYQGEYEGMYCVGCEGFKKASDLIEHEGKKVCSDHLKEPDHIKEKNWFFKLSAYQQKLEQFYTEHPEFCQPDYRFNEIKSFVAQGLEDFSISREGSDFGVQLPFDQDSVTYIWFDALYNYLTVCQEGDEAFWTNGEVVHVIGKDIGRFHAIFRPCMLKSSGNLPKLETRKEIINGYFTVDGQKMSKSIGNVIHPLELVEEHGRDALVYYLFSDIKIGNDGDFSRERFTSTKENVLKKGWGNLVARVCKMAQKNNITELRGRSKEQRIQLVGLAHQE
jgi:methionyl-tRNA synthetase